MSDPVVAVKKEKVRKRVRVKKSKSASPEAEEPKIGRANLRARIGELTDQLAEHKANASELARLQAKVAARISVCHQELQNLLG